MSILAKDPITQLAFSIYENSGIYTVLLGSGLSRSAEIPTGWEITLDLIRRVALAQGVEEQPDWAKWYYDTTGQEPNYSSLLEHLACSPEERRSILHSYIEPTEKDREEGKKIPTSAHNAIADLVRDGYLRVIITTNFDRLMENALRERGVEPTIISSVDALKGAEPITHSPCYILKLHGDYKDARILNTDQELSEYPEDYGTLLDRIFDEYGLIVCGWSGEWDHALRAALLRTPNRRYPVFWAAHGNVGEGADGLISHRGARVINITDADSFFSSLRAKVDTLEKTHRQNPLGIDMLVNSTKRYLSRPEYRIQLDEIFTEETDRLIEEIGSTEFSPQGAWSPEQFSNRIALYESSSEPLAKMAGVLGRWGDDAELNTVLDMISAICIQADKINNGITGWLKIRAYPAVLLFTAYGLGLVRAQRWKTLHQFLSSKITREHGEPKRIVESLFLWSWEGGENDVWHYFEGLKERKAALSDHLLEVYKGWNQSFIGISTDFEQLFELFEILASIQYLETTDEEELDRSIADRTGTQWVHMPVGRSGWHSMMRTQILKQIQDSDMKEVLLKAGFAKGDSDFFEKSIRNFNIVARKMQH